MLGGIRHHSPVRYPKELVYSNVSFRDQIGIFSNTGAVSSDDVPASYNLVLMGSPTDQSELVHRIGNS